MTKRTKSRMPKRTWASGRGALTAIAVLLLSSGAVRLGSGPGAAIAQEMKEQAEKLMSSGDLPGDPEEIVDVAPELLALLEETQAREAALAEREARLEARLQALALAETAIEEDLAKLEQAEAELRATMAAADKAAEDDIGRLTAVYENMKPDEAAALFQLMEPSFAAGFLGRMRSDAAAAILAGLTPDLAYTISVVLAGRNADVPREPVPEAREEMPAE